MESSPLSLEPTQVPEWDAEDLLDADLSEDTSAASEIQAREIFDKVILTLPPLLSSQELLAYAAAHDTPLMESVSANAALFDFHLTELPLNILIPDDRKLVRLRLSLEAVPVDSPADSPAGSGQAKPAVAYDLFPRDTWGDRQHNIGELSLDISKALMFVSPPPLAEALGLKLSLPLRWKTRYVSVRTSDRLSNPLEWYVRDEQITHGFTGYTIWQVPRAIGLRIDATLWGELRSSRLFGKRLKAAFRTATRSYFIEPARTQ